MTYTLNGATTSTSPTFTRPLSGNPPISLSGVGTAVHYNTLTFTVNGGQLRLPDEYDERHA
jgi:hypothetical protein